MFAFLSPSPHHFFPYFLTHLFICADEQFVISPDTNSYGRTRHGWWGQRGGVKEAALGQGSVSGESHPRGGEEGHRVQNAWGQRIGDC